jgi:hypothetical protein
MSTIQKATSPLVRFLIAVGLACLVHQLLAHFGSPPSKNWQTLQDAFVDSNKILKAGPEGLPKLLIVAPPATTAPHQSSAGAAGSSADASQSNGDNPPVQLIDPTAKAGPGSASGGWRAVQICLWGTWALSEESLECPADSRVSSDSNGLPAFGYAVLGSVGSPPSRPFFYTERFPSKVIIVASLETMLRDIEKSAFNDPGTSDVALKLCAGTRDIADEDSCRVTAAVRERLEKLLDAEINRIRLVSLFLGPFQLFTLAIFFYAILETFVLWIHWVAPKPQLFEVKGDDGAIDPASVAGLKPNTMNEFLNAPRQSIGDRIFYQGLLAGAQVSDAKAFVVARELEEVARNAGARHLSEETVNTLKEMGKSYREVVGAQLAISEQARAAAVVPRLGVYREHMFEEAQGLQERLETLGDTMLKLAFMGTVFGISSALFSARGLDTADPVLRLLAKAEMYSGIGVGFGTTLTGIILSIVAAQARSALYESWTGRIARSFERVLDYGSSRLLAKSIELQLPEHPEGWTSGKNILKPSKIEGYEVIIWIAIVIGAVYFVLKLAALI